MRSREVIRQLVADGWVEVARKGSHVQFKHPAKKGRVTVPDPAAFCSQVESLGFRKMRKFKVLERPLHVQ